LGGWEPATDFKSSKFAIFRGSFNCQYEILVVTEPRCNLSRSFGEFVVDRRRERNFDIGVKFC
jgi:hypothetical protein